MSNEVDNEAGGVVEVVTGTWEVALESGCNCKADAEAKVP